MSDLHFWLLVGFIALPGKWWWLYRFIRWVRSRRRSREGL
jgi:hypothetical protein